MNFINCLLDDIIKEFPHQCKCTSDKQKLKIDKEPKVFLSKIHILEVIFLPPYTIMFYVDGKGDKQYVYSKCMEEDVYCKEKGLELCALKATKFLIEEEIKNF